MIKEVHRSSSSSIVPPDAYTVERADTAGAPFRVSALDLTRVPVEEPLPAELRKKY